MSHLYGSRPVPPKPSSPAKHVSYEIPPLTFTPTTTPSPAAPFSSWLPAGSPSASASSPKTFDPDSAPRRNRSLARRPVPAIEDQAQHARGSSGGGNGGGPPPSSSLRRNVSTQGGPVPRFAAREPTLRVDEDEEYEEDEEDIMIRGGRKQPKKESLAELLSSAPPWAGDSSAPARSAKPNVTRSVPSSPAAPAVYRASPAQSPSSSAALNKRLGIQEPISSSPSPPDGGSPSPAVGSMRSSPSMPARSKFDSLSGQASSSASRPQARSPKSCEDDSDSDDELLGRKPKQRPLRSADLIAFLDGPPPSSMRQQPSQPDLADGFDNGTKSKKKGLRGLVSKLTGGGSGSSSSSPSSSKATDGLPPPSSYNSSTGRSNKSSAQQQHQSSGSSSNKNPVLRRSKSSDVAAGANDFMPSSSKAPFVASTTEPVPPRMRSKSQTGGSQSSIPSLDQAPPLPSKTPLADVALPARSSSRVRGSSATGAAPISTHPASASSRSSPRAPIPITHQRDPSLPTITRTSLADQESSVRPSISSIEAEAAPSRATRVALAGASLAPATILASPTMEVSPVPSEAPSFGFPSKLATPTEEKEPFGGQEKVERDMEGFDALGMPIKNVGPGPPKGDGAEAASPTELAYAAPPSAVPASVPKAEAAPAVTSPTPSVPYSSLSHLRTLLAYATTADECRLLVGALLGRWGVPLAPGAVADVAEARREKQVGRMHGWLLEEYAAAPSPPAEEEEEEGSVYESVEGQGEAAVPTAMKEEISQAGGVVMPEVRAKGEEKVMHGGEGAVL